MRMLSVAPAMASAALNGTNTRTATGAGVGTPGPGRCSWPSRSCGRVATSRSGCWSGAGGPSPHSISVVATSYLLGVSMLTDGEAGGVPRHHPAVEIPGQRDGQDLDAQVEAFRTRPLDAGPYAFVAADALVLKVREGGRTVNVHALLATGVNGDGYREILGLHVTSSEDGAGWLGFFLDLVARGLSGVALVTSDAHRGLVEAIGASSPAPAGRGVALITQPT